MKALKLFIILLIVVSIIPSIVSAAWWNPLSWFGRPVKIQDFKVQRVAQVEEIIPQYIFSDNSSQNITNIKLSHHTISFNSPWGAEKNFVSGSKETDKTGVYTFANGFKFIVAVDSGNAKNEVLSEYNSYKYPLSDEDKKQKNDIESSLNFIESKIGTAYSKYDYLKFLSETTQKKIDQAKTQQDKDGYTNVLVMKKELGYFQGAPVVYQFENQNGKGFVFILNSSNYSSKVFFYSKKDYNYEYSFTFSKKASTNKDSVGAFIKSIASTK